MARKADPVQFVLLPPRGVRAKKPVGGEAVRSFLEATAEPTAKAREVAVDDSKRVRLRVVDSIGPDGAKLIEAPADAVLAIRSLQPSLRILPVIYYTPAVAPRKQIAVRPNDARAATKVTIRLVSRSDATPIRDAFVVAYTDYASGAGAQGLTNSRGEVSLALGASELTLDRLYVYPTSAFWTLRKRNVVIAGQVEVKLRPLDFSVADGLRHYYGSAGEEIGGGVTVGIVDTGVGPHPDLVVAGGSNTSEGENASDFADNGLGHGTHVAGIVAARGTPPTGVRGVAPGVTLRAYRVFAGGAREATNFAIAKAVDLAIGDGCDLVNLSLGQASADPVIRASVDDARAAGSLCIAAAGNDGRAPVGFPAANELAVAVSAMGRKRTFPSDSAETEDVAPPPGTDGAEFIAGFSNVGPQIDVTAPGVGIISTYLADGYAEISGTSMSCPAVTGAAARLLPASGVLAMKKDAARSEAMVKVLLTAARSRGFPPELEGHGLPEAPDTGAP
jgi:subtilisin